MLKLRSIGIRDYAVLESEQRIGAKAPDQFLISLNYLAPVIEPWRFFCRPIGGWGIMRASVNNRRRTSQLIFGWSGVRF